MTNPILPSSVFNTNKTDYGSQHLIINEPAGLFDTINKPYPIISKHHERLVSLDWNLKDHNFFPCKQGFERCSKGDYRTMITTIAYQWETDSIAATAPITILALLRPSSQMWEAVVEIARNELIHAKTYSEIVKNSFDNPDAVMKDVLAIQEMLERNEVLAELFSNCKEVALRFATGNATEKEAYYAGLDLIAGLYFLERIQFMVSFAITFTYAEAQMFVPIAKAVQRICQDEYQVHQRFQRDCLAIEFATEMGQQYIQEREAYLNQVFLAVVEGELKSADFLLPNTEDGFELPGLVNSKLRAFVIYCAQDCQNFFEFPNWPHAKIDENPLPNLQEYFQLDVQGSPQEEASRNLSYLSGGIVDDTGDEAISLDDI